MKSTIRDLDDVRIIELSGKITIGSGDVKLRELIQQALDTGHSKIVLDLAGVTAIDSSGIGEMVACYTTVTKRDGELKLLRLSPKINDILQVTQLITVFDVFDTEAEALAVLRG
jgi:anti-sigma B factor antagonist